MSHQASERLPARLRKPALGRLAAPAALALVLGLVLAGTPSSPLPDSALPCVPCHHRAGSDPVGQWLASPYSEAEGGRGCTDCHGRECEGEGASETFAATSPAVDLQGLRRALRLGLLVSRDGPAVNVEVAVSNVGAGHRLPSGTAGRSLILEVDAHHRDPALLLWRAAPKELRLGPLSTEVSRHRFTALRVGPVEVAARLVLARAGAPPLAIAEAAAVGGETGEEP